MDFDSSIDIMKNIKIIENLKTELLISLANINSILLDDTADKDKYADKIADLIIYSYLLSSKLSIDFTSMDSKIINKLRINILTQSDLYKNDYIALLKSLESK